MFATQIVLLAATAVAPLASNAAPIFSGMFSKPSLARRAAENNVQRVQGTNFFFSNLHLEAVCTVGQVACVSGNLATCSQEANWEVSPCGANTSCFAVPNSDNSNINVQCIAESDANAAIESAGGQGGVSVDFQINDAPFPSNDPAPEPTEGGEGEGEAPSATEDPNAPAPSETCLPEDGSEDDGETGEEGGETGEENGEENGGDQNTEPTPTDVCTEEPEATETETITLILVPNPTESGVYETQTFTGELPAEVTGVPVAVPTEGPADGSEGSEGSDGSEGALPDLPSEGAPEGASGTETCTDSEGGYGEATDAPAPAPTEGAEGENGSSDANTASPTTLTVGAPPAAATNPPANGGVNVIGTHIIPAPTGAAQAKRFMRVVRRS